MRLYELTLITLSVVISLLPTTAHAEVSVQQSTTSSINGQTTSVQTVNDKTVIKISQGTLTIKGDVLQYCAQGCHEYILNADGTISEKK